MPLALLVIVMVLMRQTINSSALRRGVELPQRPAIRLALETVGDATRFLDVPCGLGTYWDALMERPNASIVGADYSRATLDQAGLLHADKPLSRIQYRHATATSIDLPDGEVQCILSRHFLGSLELSEDRIAVLQEFARLTSQWLIVSLKTGKTFQALNRSQHRDRVFRMSNGLSVNEFRSHFLIPESLLEFELAKSGFDVVRKIRVAPVISPYCFYVAKLRQ